MLYNNIEPQHNYTPPYPGHLTLKGNPNCWSGPCFWFTSCSLIAEKVDKPKQNGSTESEDSLQGNRQGETKSRWSKLS